MEKEYPPTSRIGDADFSRETSKPSRIVAVSWIALGVSIAVSAIISVFLGQDVNWDLQNYHFYSGYAFWTHRHFYDFAPAQLQTFFNPLMHGLTYLARGSFHPRMAAAFFGALHGLNLFLVFQISQILFRSWPLRWRLQIGIVSAVAGFCASVNLGELGTSCGDNIVSIPMLGGILLLIRHWVVNSSEKKVSLPALAASGSLMGLALAFKLTVAAYIIGVVVALPIAVGIATRRFDPVRLLAVYAGIVAGFLAGYGTWGIRLYRNYRNPFFPFFNNIFHSPFYDFENSMDATYIPHTWQKIFFFPFYFAGKTNLAGEQMHRDIRWALGCLVLVFLIVWAFYRCVRKIRKPCAADGIRKSGGLLFLALFIAFSYGSWEYLFSIYRYLSTLEWLAPLFLSLAVARFIRSPKHVLGISLVLDLVIGLSVIPYDSGRIGYDYDYLKVEIPPIPELEKSLVVMGGAEPTSYIIPQFPRQTRFVRIAANWIQPRQNDNLDRQIRRIRSQYDAAHIFLYCANKEEVENADLTLYPLGLSRNGRQCHELRSPLGHKGFLCEVLSQVRQKSKSSSVTFTVASLHSEARSGASPLVVTAGRDTLIVHVTGLDRAIDIRSTLDGRPQPLQRRWILDSTHTIRIDLGVSTPKGIYHFVGVRDSDDPDPNRWIPVDCSVQVR
jgi:hypothetical protein